MKDNICIFCFLLCLVFSVNTSTAAEENAIYNPISGEVHIPRLVVAGDNSAEIYVRDMQQEEGLSFKVTSISKNNESMQNDIIIQSNKMNYAIGDQVTLKLTNKNTSKDFVWTGSCSLILEQNTGEYWKESDCPWSGCPLCGHEREIPTPLFLTSSVAEEVVWNKKITCCSDGVMEQKNIHGRFRFVLRYAEDVLGCKSKDDPFACWIRFRDKKWVSAYSNEFNIINESVDLVDV